MVPATGYTPPAACRTRQAIPEQPPVLAPSPAEGVKARY